MRDTPLHREAVQLGRSLKGRRERRGLTLDELSDAIRKRCPSVKGLDAGTLSRIERGLMEPSLTQLRAIGRVLKFTVRVVERMPAASRQQHDSNPPNQV